MSLKAKQAVLDFGGTLQAVAVRRKKACVAAPTRAEVFRRMLKGDYIMERSSHDGKYQYCLYEGNNTPVVFVRDKVMQQLEGLVKVRGTSLVLDMEKVEAMQAKHPLNAVYQNHLLEQLNTEQPKN